MNLTIFCCCSLLPSWSGYGLTSTPVCVYMYIYIYIYTHTHTHTHTQYQTVGRVTNVPWTEASDVRTWDAVSIFTRRDWRFTRTAAVRMAGLESETWSPRCLRTKQKCHSLERSVQSRQHRRCIASGCVAGRAVACISKGLISLSFSLICPEQKILLRLHDTKMKELCLFETSEITRPTTRHRTQKNRIFSYTAANPFIISQYDSN